MVEVKFINNEDNYRTFEVIATGSCISLYSECKENIEDYEPESIINVEITIEDAEYLVEELKRKILEAKLNNHINKGGKNV